MIDISCCSCASSAWLITYPIFYHSGESLLKCYLPGMSATHRHTIAASPDFLRLKLWADGINYPPFSAMLHWKKLQGRRSNLLGIFLISGDSWIWHRLVIDISCCSCASSAWLITYPIFYHSGESLLKCYLPGMSATHRHTIAASPDFLRLKLWADGINYPPFSAMLHWKKLQRQDKSYVKSLRKGTPAFQRNATLKKATAAGQKLC